MFAKKNAPLLIGFGIPVLLIAGIIISIYLPQYFVTTHPRYNFIYTVPNYYVAPASGNYSVKDGKIILNCLNDQPKTLLTYPPTTVPATPCNETAGTQLYLYDVTTYTSRALPYNEAKQLTVTPFNESPDGYQVVRGNSGDLFFGLLDGRSDYNNWYLQGHHLNKKINLPAESASYYNFQLLGWVTSS